MLPSRASELMNQPGDPSKRGAAKPERASDKVANRLREDILSGRLPVGGRLLPERKLAEVLGVSRVTVRSAVATLQSEQLLDVRRGSGITVLDYRRSSSIDLFMWLMASNTLPVEQQYLIFSQVAKVRQTLAIPTLFEAIKRATSADRAQLTEMVKQQHRNIVDGEAYLRLDLEIGQAVARIADNIVVELLHNSLKRCMSIRSEMVLAFLGDLEEHWKHYNFILTAFQQGEALLENKMLLEQTSQIIRGFEDAGLQRVKEYLHRKAMNPDAPEPTGPSLSI